VAKDGFSDCQDFCETVTHAQEIVPVSPVLLTAMPINRSVRLVLSLDNCDGGGMETKAKCFALASEVPV
jgi:hypothetical protein